MNDTQLSSISPEAAGIPSRAVLNLIRRLEQRQLHMHSLLILRRGSLVSENYWYPYTKDDTHRMYSVSKSFVSVALGLMIDKKMLSLDSPVVSFFPGEVPANAYTWLLKTTLRDLLMMADCHEKNTYTFSDTNWLKTWFNTLPDHLPGTVFNYSTICTNLITTIIERLSGQTFLDFMRPDILDPIGFSRDTWCIEAPEGTSFGGSGICCTPRDLAKFGLLCLNRGAWQGKQLISRSYMEEATSFQIPTLFGSPYPEQRQGYGYQFWMLRHGGFACCGMGGQLAICIPEKDLLVVTTGDTMGTETEMDEIIRGVFEDLYPRISETPLEKDQQVIQELGEKAKTLTVPYLEGDFESPIINRISGTPFRLESNALHISDIIFTFEKDQGTLVYTKKGQLHEIRFGFGKLIKGVFPEKTYSGKRIGEPKYEGYTIYSSAVWAGTETLLILVQVIDDYLANLKITAAFKNGGITIRMTNTAEAFLDDYSGFASGSPG